MEILSITPFLVFLEVEGARQPYSGKLIVIFDYHSVFIICILKPCKCSEALRPTVLLSLVISHSCDRLESLLEVASWNWNKALFIQLRVLQENYNMRSLALL